HGPSPQAPERAMDGRGNRFEFEKRIQLIVDAQDWLNSHRDRPRQVQQRVHEVHRVYAGIEKLYRVTTVVRGEESRPCREADLEFEADSDVRILKFEGLPDSQFPLTSRVVSHERVKWRCG